MECTIRSRTILVALVLVITVACSEVADESPTSTATAQAPVCPPAQTLARVEFLHRPGAGCEEATRSAESNLDSFHYRKACLDSGGQDARPFAVRVARCGPASETNPSLDGSFIDVEICCGTDEPPDAAPFEARPLDCPDGRLQAMATDLHYPDQPSCVDAAQDAEASLTMAHYKRACQEGAPGGTATGAVLAASVVRCRPESSGGFMVDVALCCSAPAPSGAAGTPMVEATDVWQALRVGNLAGVKRLLVDQPELTRARGPGGVTLLHRATSRAAAEFLLSRGIDVDARDRNGQTPLHVAVSGGLEPVAELYIRRGADVDAEDHSGSRPLTFARTVELAGLLLDNGADVNGGASGTPLHAAAFRGADEVARFLLDRGADLEALDSNGETALHRAAFRGHPGVVQLLLDSGANASAQSTNGRTPRDLVGEGPNRRTIVELLRSHGG